MLSAWQIAGRAGFRIVGAADSDPRKAGQDLAGMIGLEAPLGVLVSADGTEVAKAARPATVVHATGSSVEAVLSQLVALLTAGTNSSRL